MRGGRSRGGRGVVGQDRIIGHGWARSVVGGVRYGWV